METGTEGVCMLKGDGASAICAEIRRLLDQAVRRRLDGRRAAILLSGGLDTSIIATIACRYYKPDAYTVVLRGAPAPDA
ncbi:MAG TPA: asparagine synthase-related protein, partial [Candidatus Methanomethylicus sp.]|nr:asparagine synthase-related protein [Candidatus Methanomethylicus sp.]